MTRNLTLFQAVPIFFLLLFFCVLSYSQGFEPYSGMKQVNFGLGASSRGIPIYAGMDFGLTDHISIGPRVDMRSYGRYRNYNYYILSLGFRGSYHFANHISALPDKLDLYGALTAGYSMWLYSYDGPGDASPRRSRAFVSISPGARWYFNDNWAANVEASGGTYYGMLVGLSYLFN